MGQKYEMKKQTNINNNQKRIGKHTRFNKIDFRTKIVSNSKGHFIMMNEKSDLSRRYNNYKYTKQQSPETHQIFKRER